MCLKFVRVEICFLSVVKHETFYLLSVAPELTLDESWSRKVTLRAGKSRTYKIPYTGHPEPKIEWTFNGSSQLPATVTTAADNRDITMTLKNIVRKDTGVYALHVSIRYCSKIEIQANFVS